MEFDERWTKGLCFWCEEKYVLGHQCKKKQLYKIELVEEDLLEEPNIFETPHMVNEAGIEVLSPSAQISLHTLIGQGQLPDFRTMRFSRTVRNRRINILIDSGSTHNFLDAAIAAKLGCRTEVVQPMSHGS